MKKNFGKPTRILHCKLIRTSLFVLEFKQNLLPRTGVHRMALIKSEKIGTSRFRAVAIKNSPSLLAPLSLKFLIAKREASSPPQFNTLPLSHSHS